MFIVHVAPPALHISLGTYLQFIDMFEDGCHQLDFKIAQQHPETEIKDFGENT